MKLHGIIDREQRKNNAAAVIQYYTIVFLNRKRVSCLRLAYTYANIRRVRDKKLILKPHYLLYYREIAFVTFDVINGEIFNSICESKLGKNKNISRPLNVITVSIILKFDRTNRFLHNFNLRNMRINCSTQNKYIILVKYAGHELIERAIYMQKCETYVHQTCLPLRVANFPDTGMYFPLVGLPHILSLSNFNFPRVLRL